MAAPWLKLFAADTAPRRALTVLVCANLRSSMQDQCAPTWPLFCGRLTSAMPTARMNFDWFALAIVAIAFLIAILCVVAAVYYFLPNIQSL